MRKVIIALALTLACATVFAKKGKKVQEVNFDGVDIDGKVKSPDGAYLLQKKGVDFLPLYKVKTEFDNNIKESVEYLR
jgi:hypothetical protein